MDNLNDGILSWVWDRKSEVSFVPVEIDDETVNKLFTAASLAPSTFNEQPWRFYVGNRRYYGSFEKILDLLNPANQDWAKNASLLVLAATNGLLSRNGNTNHYAMHDLGMASFSLAMQAQYMGLVTHFMGGFDQNKARDILSIPATYIIGSIIAIGAKGSYENLSPSLYKRATSGRSRRSINEFVTFIK